MKVKIDFKFLILLILLFGNAWIFGGKIFYCLFFAGIGMLFFSLLYALSAWRKMKLMVSVEEEFCNVGRGVKARYTVINNSVFKMLNLSLRFGHKNILEDYEDIMFYLNADNSKNILETHTFMYRGGYDFEDTSLVIKDPFGFISILKRLEKGRKLDVYPRMYHIKSGVKVQSHYFDADEVNSEGCEDKRFTKDIRKYTQGDDIKKIHWKASAKVDRLMVKNNEKVSGSRGFVFVDMNEENMKDQHLEEEMIDFATSVIYDFMRKKVKHVVFLNDSEGVERDIDGEYSYYEIFDYLKNTPSNGKESMGSFLKNNISKIPQGSWIGLVVMDLPRDLVEYIISLRDKGFKICVFHNDKAEGYVKVFNDYNVKTLNYIQAEKEDIKIE